ncbi:MAG: hypothetical protein GXP25_10080 [Planctomycetes bacterium]|nr:hypothetical protein [Planctomycetota bacterium]
MTGRMGKTLLAGLIVLGWTAMAFSQQPLMGKKKLRALRVAKMDAMRQLLEQVKGLELTGQTSVQDFMLEADIVDTVARGFIRGAKVISERDLGDGTIEVTMEVKVASVIANIREVMKGVYKDGRFHGVEINKVSVQTRVDALRATGKGTGDAPATAIRVGGPTTTSGRSSVAYTPVVLPPFWQKVPPAQRLGAERAAKVIAYRNLLERIKGLYITSETRVNDFVLESDRIEGELRAFLRGAEQIGRTRWLDDGTVEVKVGVPVERLEMQLKRILKGVSQGGRFKGLDYQKIHIKYGTKIIEETGRATVDEQGQPKVIDIDVDIQTKTPVGTQGGGVIIDNKTVVE